MKTLIVASGLAMLLVLSLQAQTDGTINFKRILDTPYPKHSGTAAGDMVVADFNGDKRPDILISGPQSTAFVTILHFQNPDAGGFGPALRTEHGLPAMDKAVVMRAADMDGDGDLDLVMYGRTGVAMQTALFHVYANNGSGVFSLAADLGKELPLEDFEDTNGAWGKVGNSDDTRSDAEVKGLYNGQGWSRGILELADLNGDSRPDIVFAGSKGIESGTDAVGQLIQRDWETSGVFLNSGNNRYQYLTSRSFPAAGLPLDPERQPARSFPGLAKLNRGFSVQGDFNSDGKVDLILFGQANTGSLANSGIPETQRNGKPLVEVYLGKGDGTFTVHAESGLPPLIDGACKAADLDGDAVLDLVVMGNTGSTKDPGGGRLTSIYKGKGDGSFVLDDRQVYGTKANSPAAVVPMMSGDIGIGDLDLDGDIDLIMGGNANDRALYLYLNNAGVFSIKALDRMKNGMGTNTAQGNGSADATTECDLYAGDLDGDGDVDIILNGRGGAFQLLAFLNQAVP